MLFLGYAIEMFLYVFLYIVYGTVQYNCATVLCNDENRTK